MPVYVALENGVAVKKYTERSCLLSADPRDKPPAAVRSIV